MNVRTLLHPLSADDEAGVSYLSGLLPVRAQRGKRVPILRPLPLPPLQSPLPSAAQKEKVKREEGVE